MKTGIKSNKICVLGAGLWGTVLANHLARRGRAVRLWEFFSDAARNLESSRKHPHLPHLKLADSVRVTSDLAAALEGARVVLVVLPSAHVRPTARRIGALAGSKARAAWWVSASKGIDPKTLQTMGEVLEEELPALKGRVFTLSGPSFAREVARDIPTRLVLAGKNRAAARGLKRLLEGGPLRIEWSPDRKGVELGGSLKNVLAIGCGVLDGLRAGANTKAALITQGLAEMSRLIRKSGGRAETVYGLSGIGDLIATGTSPESRNRALGEKLGSGKTLAQALREIPTVAEGAESARSARALARVQRALCPLVEAVWGVVHRGRPARSVLGALGF